MPYHNHTVEVSLTEREQRAVERALAERRSPPFAAWDEVDELATLLHLGLLALMREQNERDATTANARSASQCRPRF